MTVDEFAELQHRVRPDIRIAAVTDIDAWVDAVLVGEPRGAYNHVPPTHLLADSNDKRAMCGATDYPRCLVGFWPAHARSGLDVCPECAAVAGITVRPRQPTIFEEAS